MFVPRPYQTECVDALWHFFRMKDGHPLVVVPTGGGKSWILAEFVRQALVAHPDTRVLVATHVKELVSQDAEKLDMLLPGQVGVYSAGLNRRELDRPVTVAGIQSIARRLEALPPVDLLFVDEAHLVPKAAEGRYRTLIAALEAKTPALRVVGLTATPFRLQSGVLHEGDGRIFTDVAIDIGVSRLIDAGFLSPVRSKAPAAQAQLQGVHRRGGEYVPRELHARMTEGNLVDRAVDELIALAGDRRAWIVFCTSVAHAKEVTATLVARGLEAALVTGETPAAERAELLERFKAGGFRALVNVQVLTTGFDAPNIDCVALMRPTLSAGLYAQMVGRGLRLSPGKVDCLVLDFAGCIAEHGPIDTLTQRAAKGRREGRGDGVPPMKVCDVCREVNLLSARVCTGCRAAFPVVERERHGASASDAAILSKDVVTERRAVDRVRYTRHVKDGRPDSMRVDYRLGLSFVREWVCFEHTGFAARKARLWWRARAGTDAPVPDTVTAALEQVHDLPTPTHVWVRPEGRYLRVERAEFEKEKAA